MLAICANVFYGSLAYMLLLFFNKYNLSHESMIKYIFSHKGTEMEGKYQEQLV